MNVAFNQATVVIGAGQAGLSAAHHLGRRLDTRAGRAAARAVLEQVAASREVAVD